MSDESVNDNVTHVDFSRGRKSTVPRSKPVPSPVDTGTKLAVFRVMIADGKVMIRFVPGAVGVIVPEALKARPVNALNFSARFGLADFEYDERGVRASLSFGGINAYCDLPWSAVFAMISEKTGEAVAWPDSAPHVVVSA